MIERTFIQQNMRKIELEKYIKSQMDRAGFTGLDIVKTPLVTRIIVNVTHPGLAIGKSGQNIKRLTQELAEKFKIENPQLEIQEIKIPELDAKATVDKIKTLLERGYSWRSVAYKTVSDISNKGAQGVELVLSGALGGKGQRKRKQRIATGYMKKTGDQVKLVDYAKATSYPKYGAIGIKLRIVRPDTVFSEKIDIRELITKPKEEAASSNSEDTASSRTGETVPPLEFEKEKVEEENKANAREQKREKKTEAHRKEHVEKAKEHEVKKEVHFHKEHKTEEKKELSEQKEAEHSHKAKEEHKEKTEHAEKEHGEKKE